MNDVDTTLPDGEEQRDDGPWTDDERAACLAVRAKLIKERGLKPAQIGEVELVTITLNSKCRVDDAVKKYITFHDNLLGEYGIGDVWADKDSMAQQWHRLVVAGRDDGNRGVMWVHGGGTAIVEEGACIRACCWYFFAVHADRRTYAAGLEPLLSDSLLHIS
jgi:hypothetical protein